MGRDASSIGRLRASASGNASAGSSQRNWRARDHPRIEDRPEGHVVALDLSPSFCRSRKNGVGERTYEPHHPSGRCHNLPFPIKASISSPAGLALMFLDEDALRGLAACCDQLTCMFSRVGPFEQPFWSSTMGVVHKRVGGTLVPTVKTHSSILSLAVSLSIAPRRVFERVWRETRTVS